MWRPFPVSHVSTKWTILIFSPYVYVCIAWAVWWGQRQIHTHTQTHHHCFEEAFSSFVVVFTTSVRLNLTKQGLHWLFYMFTLTEINIDHNIVGRLLMFWLTSMFSFISLTYKNWKLAASSSDYEGCENLISPVFARLNLLKVSVSENFLPHFLWQKNKTDLSHITMTNFPLFGE